MQHNNMYNVFLSLSLILVLLPRSEATTCPTGKFLKEGQCIPCPAGTYNDRQNSTSCSECDEGTYNRFTGASSYSQCLDCPYDTFSSRGATSCEPCPKGTFARIKHFECLTCPPGRFINDFPTYRASCLECPPAFYRPAGTPPHNCLLCPSGTGSRKGATRCFKCPKGTYRDIQFISRKKMLGCRKCKRNQFADVKGSIQCKLCPLGSVAAAKGSKKCNSCPPGTFRSKIRQLECRPCPKGTTSKGMMPAGCKHPIKGCPVNTFENHVGECRACMPGERLNPRTKKCERCGDDQVSPGGITTVCQTCPPGQRPANSNTIFEKSRCECLDGTVTDGAGGCTKCPKGTRWTNRPAGAIWYTNNRESYYRESHCTLCETGFFGDEEGLSECKLCSVGTFTNTEGSTECYPCPERFISPPGNPLDDQAYEDITARRHQCIAERSGCEFGNDPDKRDTEDLCIYTGSCPPNRFPGEYYCEACSFNQFYDPEEGCKDCPPGSTSRNGGTFRECKVCPKGATALYDGKCMCLGEFGDDGNGGCKKCPEGEISVFGKCAPCGEDSYFKMTKSGPECRQCTGDTIKLRKWHRRCTKCPKGFKKGRNIFGEEINSCVPESLYPVLHKYAAKSGKDRDV